MPLTLEELEGVGIDQPTTPSVDADISTTPAPSILTSEDLTIEPKVDPYQYSQDPIDAILNQELESDRNDNAGFWPSLKFGVDGLYTSTVRVPAVLLSQSTAAWAQENFPNTAFSELLTLSAAEEAQNFKAHIEELAQTQFSGTLTKLVQAENFDEFSSTFMDSQEKWTVVKEVLGMALPGTLGIAAAAVYGGLPTAFSASFMSDFGNSYMESLEAGKNEDDALVDGATKALVQAGFDTAALGVGRVRLFGGQLKNILAQSTVQALAGGGAEYFKHLVVGESTTFGKIALEASAEFALGPLEVFALNQGDKKRNAAAEILKLFEERIRLDPEEIAVLKAKERLAEIDEKFGEGVDADTIQPDLSKIFPEDQGSDSDNLVYDFLTEAIMSETDKKSDAYIEKHSTIIDESGKPVKIGEANLEPGKVYVSDETSYIEAAVQGYKETAENMKVRMTELEQLIELQKATAPPDVDLTQNIDPILKQLEAEFELITKDFHHLENVINEYQNHVSKIKDLQQRIKGYVGTVIQKLMPDVSIVVDLGNFKQSELSSGDQDLLNYSDAGTVSPYNDKKTWFIQLNSNYHKDADGEFRPEIIETLTHELGHAITLKTLIDQPASVVNGLLVAYRNWLKALTDKDSPTWKDYVVSSRGLHVQESFFTFNTKEDAEVAIKDIIERTGDETAYYHFGLTEFLAHQAELLLHNKNLIARESKRFFKELLAKQKEFHEEVVQSFNAQPEFRLYLERLTASNRYAELQRRINATQNHRVEEAYADYVTNGRGGAGLIDKIYGPNKPSPEENLKGDLDQYNVFYKLAAGLTHLTKDNPHISGLQKYTKLVKSWWNEKMAWTVRADETLKAWTKYIGLLNRGGKGERFAKFLMDLTVKSFDSEKRYSPTSKEFIDLVKTHKIDEAGLELYARIESDFRAALDQLEEGITTHLNRIYRDDPISLDHQINKLMDEMAQLRNRNFFPLSRFGKHFVHVKASKKHTLDGVTYSLGDTISFTTFEKESDAAALLKKLSKDKKLTVQKGILSDFQQQFAGLPPNLLNVVKDKLGLSEEQQKELNLFLAERAPGQSFKKHLLNRKQTQGFSFDAMRGFANYFMHFSNHVAKIKHSKALEDAIGDVEKTTPYIQGDAKRRQQIADHLHKHLDYILNPGNELANLRSLGFLYYLGFVPKSAVVNLTQIPLVTYPYLAARFGDAKAVSEIAKATRIFKNLWKSPHKVDPEIINMLEDLKKTGIIDESMATEMAAVAEGSLVQRFAPGWASNPVAHRYIRTVAGWGAYMFQQAERSNRRITAIAAFNLARQRGFGYQQAMEQAETAVESTQYEYARWNRPFFAQKKRSVFFLFWQYKTNAMHFALKDPGNTRYLTMMFLAAGLSGLPFAEDIMDLYDFMARKLNKAFGEDTAPPDIRLELREVISTISNNPDLMMHGSSRYLFGLPQLADMVGIPLANADISGSLSMGRMVPGVGGFLGREGEFNDSLSRGAEELGGAVLAVPFNMIKAIADDNPNSLKRWERAMPSVAKNFSKAYRYATEGEDAMRGGAGIAEFDLQDARHRSEIIMQTLGFAPTRVQERKEQYWMTQELVQYYETRRRLLMQDYDYARQSEDITFSNKVMDAIRDFNDDVPIPGFRINTKDLRKSLKSREKRRRLVERGVFTSQRGHLLEDRIESAFSQQETAQQPLEDDLQDFVVEPLPKGK